LYLEDLTNIKGARPESIGKIILFLF